MKTKVRLLGDEFRMKIELNVRKQLRRRMLKNPVQLARNITQLGIAVFLVYIGIQFYQFYLHFATAGETAFVERPAAVEGFLPISALLAFKLWITTGFFDPIHPAGLVLFTFFVASGFIFRRTFCSWFCPVGTVSEWVGNLGKKLFKRNYNPPKWLRWFLYSLKYLILVFFFKVIFIDWAADDAFSFLNTPYNKIADVKMMLFFIDIGKIGFIVIAALIILSLFIKHFWCRFLCPYGALIGLGSLFRLTKITRDETSCIDCQACNRACPNKISVSTQKAVLTPECTACMQCIEACPVNDTLNMTIATKKSNRWLLPLGFFALFFIVVLVAKLTGHWQTNITNEEFEYLIQMLLQTIN